MRQLTYRPTHLLGLSAVLLLAMVAAPASADLRQPGGAYLNRSRAGERLDSARHEMVTQDIAPLVTVDAAALSAARVVALARLFDVRPAAITRFRWGRSLAPATHPLARGTWYTIWYRDELRPWRSSLTIRVGAGGRVVEVVER